MLLEKSDGTDVVSLTMQPAAVKHVITWPGSPTVTFEVGHDWLDLPLASPVILASGATYHLVLSAPGGPPYRIYPNRDGGGYGFKSPWLWTDGWAQYSSDGGATWRDWPLWGAASKTMDLQAYFTG